LFFISPTINIILGVIILGAIYTEKIDNELKKKIKSIHIWLGMIVFILSILNIIVGYIIFLT